MNMQDWGTYCPHKVRIIEAVPAEHTCGGEPQPLPRTGPFESEPEREYCKACYPEGRKVRPWPCPAPECSEAAYDRAQEEEIDAYYEEMRQALWG